MTKPTGRDLPAAVRHEINLMVIAISRGQFTQEQAMQEIARYCLSERSEAEQIITVTFCSGVCMGPTCFCLEGLAKVRAQYPDATIKIKRVGVATDCSTSPQEGK